MKMIIYAPGQLFYVNCNSDTELCPNKIGKIGLTPLQIMMMMTAMMIISNFTQLVRVSMESEALSGCI
jgi:hypothetical protein